MDDYQPVPEPDGAFVRAVARRGAVAKPGMSVGFEVAHADAYLPAGDSEVPVGGPVAARPGPHLAVHPPVQAPPSHGSLVTKPGWSRRGEKKSHDMARLMFSASARFSSALVSTGSIRPCRSSSVSRVASAGSDVRSVICPCHATVRRAPASAERAFSSTSRSPARSAGLPASMVCSTAIACSCASSRCALPDDLAQWPTWHKQVDKIAPERIGRPAQRVQADPVGGLSDCSSRVTAPAVVPSLACQRCGAHSKPLPARHGPSRVAGRARAAQRLPLLEVPIEQFPAPDGHLAAYPRHASYVEL